MAAFAQQTGLTVWVCHLPPGTSKWNRIEHKLFSFISMNWRGRPLTSHEVIVNTIGATATAAGLTVQAELDTGIYPKDIDRVIPGSSHQRLIGHPARCGARPLPLRGQVFPICCAPVRACCCARFPVP